MRRTLFLSLFVPVFLLGGLTAAGAEQVPFRLIPFERLGVSVKDWDDESLPNYTIIGNIGEWDLAFPPVAGRESHRPRADFFEREQMIAISRVSAPPAPGQRVLVVKSLELVDGELLLTYSFIPPAGPATGKVKNTILVALPASHQYGLRFMEEEESPESLAAHAELEAARAAGRYKQP